jgi:hypothetical protein
MHHIKEATFWLASILGGSFPCKLCQVLLRKSVCGGWLHAADCYKRERGCSADVAAGLCCQDVSVVLIEQWVILLASPTPVGWPHDVPNVDWYVSAGSAFQAEGLLGEWCGSNRIHIGTSTTFVLYSSMLSLLLYVIMC